MELKYLPKVVVKVDGGKDILDFLAVVVVEDAIKVVLIANGILVVVLDNLDTDILVVKDKDIQIIQVKMITEVLEVAVLEAVAFGLVDCQITLRVLTKVVLLVEWDIIHHLMVLLVTGLVVAVDLVGQETSNQVMVA